LAGILLCRIPPKPLAHPWSSVCYAFLPLFPSPRDSSSAVETPLLGFNDMGSARATRPRFFLRASEHLFPLEFPLSLDLPSLSFLAARSVKDDFLLSPFSPFEVSLYARARHSALFFSVGATFFFFSSSTLDELFSFPFFSFPAAPEHPGKRRLFPRHSLLQHRRTPLFSSICDSGLEASLESDWSSLFPADAATRALFAIDSARAPSSLLLLQVKGTGAVGLLSTLLARRISPCFVERDFLPPPPSPLGQMNPALWGTFVARAEFS